MKRLIYLLSIISTGTLAALPVGNPADASLLWEGISIPGRYDYIGDPCISWYSAWSVRLGFYGDYVFQRYLEVEKLITDSKIAHSELTTNAAFIAFNLWDYMDLYTTLGASSFAVEADEVGFLTPGAPVVMTTGSQLHLNSDTAFSWSVGIRGTFFEFCNTTIGGQAQYFSFRPEVTHLRADSDVTLTPDHLKATYHEWQAGVGITHRLGMFLPYAALKSSGATLKFNRERYRLQGVPEALTLFDIESSKLLGGALGLTALWQDIASVTTEWRFGDEQALYVNAQFRY